MTSVAIRGAAVLMLVAPALPGFAAPPVPAPAQVAAGPESRAAEAVDAFHSALRRGEVQAALALMAEGALVFEDGRVERTKAEYALHHAGADAAYSKATSSKRLARNVQAAGDMALVATESRTRGRFNGSDVDRMMVETMILRRGPGAAWRIVHIHWSSARPSTE